MSARQLEHEYLANSYSDTYSLNRFEIQSGFRFPIGRHLLGTIGISCSRFQRSLYSFPDVRYPNTTDVRLYSTNLYHAISVRPSLSLHYNIETTYLEILVGVRGFVNTSASGRRYQYERAEFYTWDSLGNIHPDPDSVRIVFNDWHDHKTSVEPKAGAEASVIVQYSAGGHFALFVEGTFGITTASRPVPYDITYSAGAGIAFLLYRIRPGPPEPVIFDNK